MQDTPILRLKLQSYLSLKKNDSLRIWRFLCRTSCKACKKKLEDLSGYSKVFYCNSGTEAVEAAIKLAFWKTKRQGLISFYNSFHGRTLGSLSLTCSKARQKEHFPVLHTAHSHYAYCYRCPFKLEYPPAGSSAQKSLKT